MDATLRKKLDFKSIITHFFCMNFKGRLTWDIDKEGWMILAHRGGLTEYTTELQHFEKILVREEDKSETITKDGFTTTTTSRLPVYAYVCVVRAHVVIDGVPGSRTINLRSDTIRRKQPIGQDNLVSTADTSATKGAIRFALGITKEDVQQLAMELKLDPGKKTLSISAIPTDVEDDEDTSPPAIDPAQAKAQEDELWK